jgi:hypothetical protein
MNFSVKDNAGNTNTSSVQVEIANIKSLITITYPPTNSSVNNITTLKASLSDPRDVSEVKYLLIKDGSYFENVTMFCTWDYSLCTASLNTTKYQDGTYTILARAISNQKGILANSTIVLRFNNTNQTSTNQTNVTVNVTSGLNNTNNQTNQTEKNETKETNQTTSNIIKKFYNVFANPKVLISLGSLGVLVAVALIILDIKRKAKQAKPWYESISD